jgi:hypothetical protein
MLLFNDASQSRLSLLCTAQAFVRIKHEPPYTEADEKAVYLNPIARATYDPVKETWMFKPGTAGQAQQPRSPAETQMAEALQQSMQVRQFPSRVRLPSMLRMRSLSSQQMFARR